MRIGIAALAALLTACQSSGLEAAQEARPANTPGFVWYMLSQSNSPHATLLFAPQESDNIAINFSCDEDTRRVRIETFNAGTDGSQLYLASGKTARTFAAKRLPPDEFYGDSVVSVLEAPVDDPVLAAFRASGAIAKGSPPLALRTATSEERAEIEAFFDFCGA